MTFHLELLHGAENAFALLDARVIPPFEEEDFVGIARALGDTDGLLVVLPSAGGDVRMRMFNPDGSEAENCGNGIRCIARYLDEREEGEHLVIDTLAGPIATRVVARAPYAIETAFPVPRVGAESELVAAGRTWRFTPVDVGNPHAVIFVDDPRAIDLARVGPAIEKHPDFPDGTNVHFVGVADERTLDVTHWERGAGATRACGTGIVASAAAAIVRGTVRSPVTVHVPGGTLSVAWERECEALLTGPVEHTGARDLALA